MTDLLFVTRRPPADFDFACDRIRREEAANDALLLLHLRGICNIHGAIRHSRVGDQVLASLEETARHLDDEREIGQ